MLLKNWTAQWNHLNFWVWLFPDAGSYLKVWSYRIPYHAWNVYINFITLLRQYSILLFVYITFVYKDNEINTLYKNDVPMFYDIFVILHFIHITTIMRFLLLTYAGLESQRTWWLYISTFHKTTTSTHKTMWLLFIVRGWQLKHLSCPQLLLCPNKKARVHLLKRVEIPRSKSLEVVYITECCVISSEVAEIQEENKSVSSRRDRKFIF